MTQNPTPPFDASGPMSDPAAPEVERIAADVARLLGPADFSTMDAAPGPLPVQPHHIKYALDLLATQSKPDEDGSSVSVSRADFLRLMAIRDDLAAASRQPQAPHVLAGTDAERRHDL